MTCEGCNERTYGEMTVCVNCFVGQAEYRARLEARTVEAMEGVARALVNGPLSALSLRRSGVIVRQLTMMTALKRLEAAGYVEHTGAGWGLISAEPYKFGSAVEESFWKSHKRLHLPELHGLVPQHPVDQYRLDFAIPGYRYGVEIDGLAYHNGQESFMRDRKRQRHLESLGWRITRFAAKEIMLDVEACVVEAGAQANSFGVNQ
jgi:very-short-patch-repair endonuclease